MAKSFGSLLEKMSPERRERVEEHAQSMLRLILQRLITHNGESRFAPP